MAGVTFTGLSSGIDTASLVDQLVGAERARADALSKKQSDLNTQKSIVNSLASAVAAFGTAARNMDTASELAPRTATSSDSAVSVAVGTGAAATLHDIHVTQLARGQITASRTFATQGAGAAGDGTLKITTGDKSASISYSASDSLASIASKINSAGAGATASVLYDGTSYRLMVSATATGTAAAPKFEETGTGLGLTNVKVAAQDAKATIDGVEITRGSNVIGDAVDGLTLTLNSAHTDLAASSKVTVALDSNGLKDKVKALVSAYNSVNSALHVQLDYTGTTKGTNTLFGDSSLRQLQGAMGTLMSSSYGDTTLGSLGLTRAKDGALTLDEAKLSAALGKDPDAVAKVFVQGGFAAAVTKMTDTYTRAGDGVFASKTTSLNARHKTLQTQIDQINTRADSLKTQLEAQFTALETAMSKMKSQSSYLSSVLG